MASFTQDIKEIRQRAERKIEEGAVTESYNLDKDQAIAVLNEALATELVCVMRYMHHYYMATGVHGKAVAAEFKEHADDEREHADEIGERIAQLGGKPDFNPGTLLQRSVSQYVEGESLADMIKEDLIAERMVIEVYQRMIEFFGMKDPVTRAMLEHIKGEEEEHADDLSDLLYVVNPATGEEEGQDPGTDPLHIQGSASAASQQRISRQQHQPAARASDRGQSATSQWGNESNFAGRGQGGSPKRSTAPQGQNWGNEQNVGRRSNATRGDQRDSGKGSDRQNQSSNSRRDLERNAPVHEATAGMNKSNRSGSQKSENTNITNRSQSDRSDPGTARPTRERGSSKESNERAVRLRGENEPPASNIGGVSGRTMNRRGSQNEISEDDVAERPNVGAQSGTNRTPKILQKNRKGKRAA